MEKKSEDFRDFNMQQAMKLAQSDAARQLFAMLQSSDPVQLRSAMDHATAGDMEQARKIMEQMMASQQAQALLRQLQGDANG